MPTRKPSQAHNALAPNWRQHRSEARSSKHPTVRSSLRDDGGCLKTGPLRIFLHCAERIGSSYDAIYLDLAISRSLPLATLDGDLRRTARKLGIGLLRS